MMENDTQNVIIFEAKVFSSYKQRRVQPLRRGETRVFDAASTLDPQLLDDGQVSRAVVQLPGKDRDWEVKRNIVNELHTVADCGSVGWGSHCNQRVLVYCK